jgi:hypothetical protein
MAMPGDGAGGQCGAVRADDAGGRAVCAVRAGPVGEAHGPGMRAWQRRSTSPVYRPALNCWAVHVSNLRAHLALQGELGECEEVGGEVDVVRG